MCHTHARARVILIKLLELSALFVLQRKWPRFVTWKFYCRGCVMVKVLLLWMQNGESSIAVDAWWWKFYCCGCRMVKVLLLWMQDGESSIVVDAWWWKLYCCGCVNGESSIAVDAWWWKFYCCGCVVCLTLDGKMAALCRVKVLLWMREVVGLSHTPLALLRCMIGGSCHKWHFCRDGRFVFVATKLFCRDKSMLVATKRICDGKIHCHDKHSFVATKDVFCRDKNDTGGSSRQP